MSGFAGLSLALYRLGGVGVLAQLFFAVFVLSIPDTLSVRHPKSLQVVQ